MNNPQTILDLLRIALGNADATQIPADVNWQEVMDYASAQGILGVAFDGIQNLPVNVPHNAFSYENIVYTLRQNLKT